MKDRWDENIEYWEDQLAEAVDKGWPTDWIENELATARAGIIVEYRLANPETTFEDLKRLLEDSELLGD